MRFTETPLAGAYVIDIEPIVDERGFFARTWCQADFAKYNLRCDFVQSSLSYNRAQATLRGMHYQREPHAEIKLVQCIKGAISDVILDLRPDSPTYKGWFAATLSEDNHRMMYVPEGVAHGFQTLQDKTDVLYCISHPYHPEYVSGVRWDDPAFQIEWPASETRIISAKDAAFPDFGS